MASKKIQLYTDRDKTIEASPETSANCVILSDGNDLQKVLDNDLTTPTVVHEETSFKVGAGDVNVSSSVVDGESSKVVIKGKTYQNILPEPSLRNSMTNGKSMQKLNEGYENVNVVDGVAKSAILKGNTLVNLNNGQRNETLDSTIGNGSSRTYACKIPYTIPSGTYITFKLKTNTINGITGNLKAHFKQNAATTTTGDRYPTLRNYNSHPTGEYYINVCHQTPIDLEAINLYIDDNVGVIDVSDVMILIGDYTNVDIPYFEGMQSVRMPVLQTTGKNMVNILDFTEQYSNGYYYDNPSTLLSKKVYIDYDGQITLSCKGYSKNVMNGRFRFVYTDGTTKDCAFLNSSDENNPVIIANKSEAGKKVDYITFTFSSIDSNPVVYFKELQVEEGAVATTYEPYKSNILSTPSDLELRGVGDVQDELNLLTGELTNYYGERIVTEEDSFSTTLLDGKCTCIVGNLTDKISSYSSDNFLADKVSHGAPANTDFGIYQNLGNFVIYETGDDLEAFKAKVIGTKIYYRLAEPVHKTVDLSSYGNWEKVVLDGSETGWTIVDSQTQQNSKYFTIPLSPIASTQNCIVNGMENKSVWNIDNVQGIIINSTLNSIHVRVLNNNLPTQDVNGLKQYLSQNPITVWYQTTTSKENSITEVLSFSNGHIQLSSEEGSLIPSLNYEVPTSNSYHMDLMKANSVYTMKLSAGNGAFVAHNGQEIGYMISRPFNSGQLPVNNLFYTTGWVNDLMILEGDLTSKALPYFKGIKSAFEDESKIEVLSTGKNLFDRKLSEYDYLGNYDKNEVIIGDNFIEWNASSTYKGAAYYHFYVKPNTSYTLSLERNIMQRNCTTIYDGFVTSNMNSISNMEANKNNISFVTLSNKITIRFSNGIILNETFKIYNVQLEEGGTVTTYEPYKSNSTKIPLLSPLRSLPNGACDELIIDRMKKKATLIQRVGKAMFDGSDNEIWGFMDSPSDTTSYLYQCYVRDAKANSNDASEHLLCKNILVRTANSNWNNKYESGIALNENKNIQLRCTKDESSFRSWLSKNPTTVYYQLETPVVTEVDLEGFPYIYKDGHIFLNSEIAPVVEIAYNVNQTQQIQANNETLQRHELDILDLDNLIVSFVNAEYNLRLLKFDMELSMMALAE